jgi:hypothetical protein
VRVNGKGINKMRAADRCPEKAGVGGSSPSLATTFSITYGHSKNEFHSVSFQNPGSSGLASRTKSDFWDCLGVFLDSARRREILSHEPSGILYYFPRSLSWVQLTRGLLVRLMRHFHR